MAKQVVGAAIVVEGRVLLLRRARNRALLPGSWDIPGGHVEEGETLEEALAREIEEEAGWRLVEIRADLGAQRWVGDDGVDRVEHDYLVTVEGDLDRPTLAEGEHDAHQWVTADRLRELLREPAGADSIALRVAMAGLDLARDHRYRY